MSMEKISTTPKERPPETTRVVPAERRSADTRRPKPISRREGVSEAQGEQAFINKLISVLNRVARSKIDATKAQEIIRIKTPLVSKIKMLLAQSGINEEEVWKRKGAYDAIHDFLAPRLLKQERRVMDEIAGVEIEDKKRLEIFNQRMDALNREYGVEELKKYLGLDVELTRKERRELNDLDARKENLTPAEGKRLWELREKAGILAELND